MSGRSMDELVQLLRDTLARAADEREPVTYEQLEAYVDERLDDVDREIVESQLADDPALRAEVEALRELRAALPAAAGDAAPVIPFAPRAAPAAATRDADRPAWWWVVPSGMAAAAALALLVWRASLPPAPPTANASPAPPAALSSPASSSPMLPLLHDRGRAIALRPDGTVAGLDATADDVRAAVAASLRDGRLPASPSVAGLGGRAGVLLGDARARAGFAPVGPRATAVATATPTFRWTPLAGATAYRVRVVDASLAPVAHGEPVTTTTWRPPAALPRGRVLLWQVEAETLAGTRTTPVPPDPEARLLVLPAVEAERAAAALAAQDSDLAAAVVAARAGLYDDAEAALVRLGRANPGSPEVAALRAELAARRRGR